MLRSMASSRSVLGAGLLVVVLGSVAGCESDPAASVRHPRADHLVGEAVRNNTIHLSAEEVDGAAVLGDSTGTIGVLRSPAHEVFGKIEDVLLLDGRILVLDSRQNEVRVFDRRGDYLGSFGGPGQGPGEFQLPRTLVHLPAADRIAVLDEARRVQLFTTDSVPEFVSQFRVDFLPYDACSVDGKLVVHGFQREDGQIFHVFEPGGRKLVSFGRIYDSDNFAVDYKLARGQVACLEEEGRLYFASRILPQVRIYATADGALLRILTVQDHRQMMLREDPDGSITQGLPEPGDPDSYYHLLREFLLVPERGIGIVQYARHTLASARADRPYDSLEASVFPLNPTAAGGGAVSTAARIVASDARGSVTVNPLPYPRLVIGTR